MSSNAEFVQWAKRGTHPNGANRICVGLTLGPSPSANLVGTLKRGRRRIGVVGHSMSYSSEVSL